MTYVIVDMGGGKLKYTRVKDEHISVPKAPKSREEATLLQHPDINNTMNKLTAQLAQCALNCEPGADGSPPAIVSIFFHRLQEATRKQLEKPRHKARWRQVDFIDGKSMLE